MNRTPKKTRFSRAARKTPGLRPRRAPRRPKLNPFQFKLEPELRQAVGRLEALFEPAKRRRIVSLSEALEKLRSAIFRVGLGSRGNLETIAKKADNLFSSERGARLLADCLDDLNLALGLGKANALKEQDVFDFVVLKALEQK